MRKSSQSTHPEPRVEKVRFVSTIVLTFAFAITLLHIYYSTPLRSRVEDMLYDIRVRMAPSRDSISDIVVLAVDEATLSVADKLWPHLQDPTSLIHGSIAIDLERWRGQRTKASNLTYGALVDVARRLAQTKAANIAVVLPPQIFSYTNPQISKLVDLVARDQRFSLGVFDLTLKGGGPEALPPLLRPVANQVFKADFTRAFRREIARKVVVKQKGELDYLSWHLGARLNPAVREAAQFKQPITALKTQDIRIMPNLVHPDRIPTISLARWLGLPSDQTRSEWLEGKTVLLGYTAYRPATVKVSEATFVNTPWQEEGHDVVEGVPLVTSLAMTVHSIGKLDWLSPLGTWVNLMQTLCVALLSVGVWRFSVGLASFLFIGGWSMLLVLHSFLFARYSLYIPLADTALASGILTTVGALVRLRLEGRVQAAQEAKVAADIEVASVQDRFLNTFAEQLAHINHKVRDCLQLESSLGHADQKKQLIFAKAIESCEELDDYLNGIKHFSRLEASLGGKAISSLEMQKNYQNIDLNEMIPRILAQFDARIREKKLQLLFVPSGTCLAYSDRPIVAQILYNLISNGIKYSPDGAKVSIVALSLTICTKVAVVDEGPGIDPSLHEKIFEKFYRVKSDLVFKVKGHGLGLYLSQYFARLIQAKIEVESALGKGSTFTLILPPPQIPKHRRLVVR